MSSTRPNYRQTNINKSTTLHTHHTNGSANTYENNESIASNTSELDSNFHRSVSMKNASQTDGIYRNPRFIHAITSGLLGQQVILQTNEQERYHGVLETISANGDVLLSVAHRLDTNNNDIINLSTSSIDLIDTIDSSSQTFELQKRVILASNIVEIIAVDVDLTGPGKCALEETPKVTPLEDERFNRMEHFFGSDDIDAEALGELELGDDGKSGFDPEDMFHTNREKFNTTTDFDESKYTNVPVPQMSATELAEIERKALEIEKGTRYEDIDEDDAGVKRPSEYNPMQHNDDGNPNSKGGNVASRSHPNDRRSDFRYDAEYNPSKRGSWREQRGGAGGNTRRGGTNNYSMNNPKQNQRPEQSQYASSRSSDQQSNNNRQQQQYNNPRTSRPNRYNENRSPQERRDSPSQQTNVEETARGQRINSGSFSQGPNSGSTSPSTAVPARAIHSTNNRAPPLGRNSPAPYTGSSSSRNNSVTATSPTPNSSTSFSTNPTAAAGPNNYSQQSNNKMAKSKPRNEHQHSTDETDQPKPARNQQSTPASSSTTTTPSNSGPLSRPSQLHTQQQTKPQTQPQPQQQQSTPQAPTQPQPHQVQAQQQQQQLPQQHPPSSSMNPVPTPLTLPPQDDHPSSHESIAMNQPDATSSHMTNPSAYTQPVQPHTTGIPTPVSAKPGSDLNPEADEFVPGLPRESNSRPESRGAPNNPMPMNTFIQHAHSQAFHPLQQQQQQQQQLSMMPLAHGQNPAAIYPPYYSASYPNMPQFVHTAAAAQQMNVGMMGASMMPQQALPGSGPNTGNTGATGLANANGGAGPTYKTNANQSHSGDPGNTGVNNTAPKKAVVSVQRAEQSTVPQQTQVLGPPSVMLQNGSVRYLSPEYMTQQANSPSMSLQPVPMFGPINTSPLIQGTSMGPGQNIMVQSAGPSSGPVAQAPGAYYYSPLYGVDPRAYGPHQSINPANVNPNWPHARSPPHQQAPQGQQQVPPQVNDPQRAYPGSAGGQGMVSQVPPPTGAPNAAAMSGRTTSTAGLSGQTGTGGPPPMTHAYQLSGNVPTAAYAYGPSNSWYGGAQQISSPQSSMPPQMNAFAMMYDASQQQPMPQQVAFMHPNAYDQAYFQQVQAQQQAQQAGLDTVPPGNYNR